MATVIRNATQLQAMSGDLTADYELGNDINASETAGWNGGLGFDPIGSPGTPFIGNFDGKGYKIIDLTINRPTETYVALFGITGGDGTVIQNVGLEDVSIVGGNSSVAALVGFNNDERSIINCWATGSVTASSNGSYAALCAGLLGYTEYDVTDCYFSGTFTIDHTADASRARQNGGLIGLLGGGTAGILRCYTTGDIIFNGRVASGSRCWELGGLIGMNSSGAPLTRCYSTMDITLNDVNHATEEFYAIGGFIGENNSGDITDCYARGFIDATGGQVSGDYIGGFVGWNSEILRNCYSTGLITTNAAPNVGGFCGDNNGGTVTDCFWDTETSGQAASDGGTGKTTAQMKTVATFQAAGWAISRIWNILTECNNGYPCLIDVNTCCMAATGGSVDESIVGNKVSLEAIRNIEMVYGGRFYIDKSGNAVYESRYHRQQ